MNCGVNTDDGGVAETVNEYQLNSIISFSISCTSYITQTINCQSLVDMDHTYLEKKSIMIKTFSRPSDKNSTTVKSTDETSLGSDAVKRPMKVFGWI